jgi:hypothetical protein
MDICGIRKHGRINGEAKGTPDNSVTCTSLGTIQEEKIYTVD